MKKYHEFELIQHYFARGQRNLPKEVIQGIGDDCAIVAVPPKQQLAITMDTLVAGVHFPLKTAASDIGHKALAVNLSDLAAQGATPAWVTLALTLPKMDPHWLREFATHFFRLAKKFKVTLIGGDTTRGPLSLSIAAHGFIPCDSMISRSGAKAGDLIYVTNTLGDAGFALHLLKTKKKMPLSILHRLNRPMPRVREGLFLRQWATAMIDISDGLVADLQHILTQSNVGARLNVDQIPLSRFLANSLPREKALEYALSSGDDYELCFTLPAIKKNQFEKILRVHRIKACCIGEVTATKKCVLTQVNGNLFKLSKKGYLHF